MTIEVNKFAMWAAVAVTAVILVYLAAHVLFTLITGMVLARLIPHVPTLDQIRAATMTRQQSDGLVGGDVVENAPILLEEVRLRRNPRNA